MKKVFINKWFLLAAFLTVSLSAFSFIAYKNSQICTFTKECCQNKPTESNQRSDMLWDVISKQFTSFISVQ
jgi:hypothetical protein